MNEFVDQFLIECRELIDQATDDLLTLEGRPDDTERLDGAFRAFHTLKGAAGIVDFDAMGRALHAAEDVLSRVRAGTEPVTPNLISDCLTCLDQVVQWLDAMQVDGEIPAGAEAAADAVVRRFRREAGPAAAAPALISSPWLEPFLARHADVQATVAIRYAPDAEAFLRGDDPLARLAAVPDLRELEFEGGAPWPALGDLDPFQSRLSFLALAECPPDSARRALGEVFGEVEVRLLASAEAPRAGLAEAAQGLVEAQLRLLENAEPEGSTGRTAAAGQVVGNVLRHARRLTEAAAIERATAGSLAAGSPDALSSAIQRLLAGEPAEPVDPVPSEAAVQAPIEAAARTLRVDVERIDALVNLTGELLVAKNALGHAAAQAHAGIEPWQLAAMLKDQHAVLHRLVDDLQRSVLNIRVLQMRYVFQRFPRLVREMVVNLGKPAHLVTEGDETEADKVIVESLFEPLLHVLRNALDHGIEAPGIRAALGKPAAATVTLRAHRLNDNVIVEVEDDGAGIDVERVRAVAERRGVATAEALASMADRDIVELIFAPGFSTAAEVTNLSGRGVGMDAVRSAIERLGGRVSVVNRPERGTTVRFTLPFAILMSRVLTVEAGGQLFGIPLEAVLETVRVSPSQVSHIGAARAFVLRERTIPLIDLDKALGDQTIKPRVDEANVVVVSASGQIGGLEVARLGERLDVMLKPMAGLLSGMPGISGTTLLGDGRVLLVLDLQELLQ